ncbi:MAG TPA: hypothetical protein G4N96_06420 [Chloroflexi bacterium]|nr:hypothetical protein [Chloroflexota bacterium]
MSLIWPIVKKTLLFLWDESFLLVIFNVLTVIIVAGGPVLLMTGLTGSIESLLLGAPLLLAMPLAIFGLFWLTYQISEGKAVKFSAYFLGAKALLKPAYVWGGINLGVGFLLATNIAFYRGQGAAWGIYAAAFFAGLTLFWFALQLLALSLYPRLVEPGFKLAIRNALVLLGMRPTAALALLLLSLIVIVLGMFVPLTAIIISFSFVALLTNVTTAEILKDSEQNNE